MNDREQGLLARGLFYGLLIGSIIGLWNAPRSGRETRQEIQNRITTLGTEAESTAKDTLDKIQHEPIQNAIERGKSIAHQQKAQHARPAHAIRQQSGPPDKK